MILALLYPFFPPSFTLTLQQLDSESKSELFYRYPRQLKVITTSPPSTLLIKGDLYQLYTPPFIEGEKGDLIERKIDNADFVAILDGLSGRLQSNSIYQLDKKSDRLIFTLRNKDNILERATLIFRGPLLFDHLSNLELVYRDKRVVQWKVLSLHKKKLSDHIFVLHPRNVRVIK